MSEITAGFADPVLDAQKAFRHILDALSNPGRVETFDIALVAPEGLDHATAVTLLTVADFETPLWLPPSLAETAGPWLRFHAAVRLTADPAEAAFAVLTGAAGEPQLAAFQAGDDLYPDRSTTVFLQCAGFQGGDAVSLTGPGIKNKATIAPTGLPNGFWPALRANNTRYPRGVDVILVSGPHILGLPRSLTITLPTKEAA